MLLIWREDTASDPRSSRKAIGANLFHVAVPLIIWDMIVARVRNDCGKLDSTPVVTLGTCYEVTEAHRLPFGKCTSCRVSERCKTISAPAHPRLHESLQHVGSCYPEIEIAFPVFYSMS